MSRNQLLNTHLSNLRVNLLYSKLSHCTTDWKRFNTIPTFNKIYYICDGEGWIKIGNQEFMPKPGDLLFIPAGTLQSFSVTEGRPYTKYWCHFNSNVAFMPLFRWFGLPHLITVRSSDELQRQFQLLIDNLMKTGGTTSLKIQSALLSVIALFIERAMLECPALSQSDSIDKLMDTIRFIDANLSKEITLEELSQIAHFHPNYLIRVFKRHLGMPPHRYIHERRIKKAEQLLASTEMTVNEVAQTLGFNDVSYFSASFKKTSGVSPSEYRNLLFKYQMSL
ncbi:AraC family transcriptional regulator [Paenibacillus allorhizosphaerae]|uniref:Arabinose operon regulatory protein n=1 Tax=Paenibacillus allorhizosphaerae TaxID=2849866 RepID=A0ABM8VF36_9BACL|nr:AraC family transcriptional regulator [Paenibacillus allorhizosphaerae]CAG7633549.1 Arabinose operon regulatory protein [Paenibacillus allorhizosphaerae]